MTIAGKDSLFVPFIFLVVIAMAGMVSSTSRADEFIGVIYPATKPPFDQVYLSIIEGLEQQSGSTVVVRTIDKASTAEEVQKWSQEESLTSFIGLGRRSVKLAPPSLPTVFGGSSFYPRAETSFSAVSLVPTPVCLLNELNHLRPNIEVVHVVAAPKYKKYLEYAKKSASAHGLTIQIHSSDSQKASAGHFKRLLGSMNSKKEALWLLGGVDRALFNNILKSSWQRRLVVFSNSVAHVKKGTLFTCYGDFSQHSAALLATLKENTEDMPVLKLADKPLLGINVRTAKHLGIRVSTQSRYSMTFPME